MAPVDAHNSAIPGAISPQIGEDLSEMWPNRHAKFHADRLSPGWEIRNRTEWMKKSNKRQTYIVSQKKRAKLFFFWSEHCQISTNFDNFRQKDGKEAEIMQGALTFRLT